MDLRLALGLLIVLLCVLLLCVLLCWWGAEPDSGCRTSALRLRARRRVRSLRRLGLGLGLGWCSGWSEHRRGRCLRLLGLRLRARMGRRAELLLLGSSGRKRCLRLRMELERRVATATTVGGALEGCVLRAQYVERLLE